MIDINTALHSLCPGCEWVLINNDYSQIRWVIEPELKPTLIEIQSEIARLQDEYDANEYQRKRAKEYPQITDYLDGIVKGDEEQVQAYIDKCLEIKAKYPKGE
jgi:hypothetical protein